MLARQGDRLGEFASLDRDHLVPIACDLTDPTAVTAAFETAEKKIGPLECAVFNAGTFRPGSILDTTPEDFRALLADRRFRRFPRRAGSRSADGRKSRRDDTVYRRHRLVPRGAKSANLASPKFALRALAQSMARELGPKGVHVAHIIIDGQIRSERFEPLLAERGLDSLLDPDAIADVYLHLHQQPRSTWAHEVDLRPWTEKF
jgi:NAD(P)-dependent dehydrogenase (short-subunit alcohol dehydrogenase family)